MREFGLIGRTLSHSFSKSYFTEKFEKEGVANAKYSLFELDSIEEFPALLASTPNLCGLSVTIPYKQQIMRYLDEISQEAQAIGAVNCVEFRDGRLIGHNTDIVGVRESLAELLGGVMPSRALVLGTGGAAQAVIYCLAQMGVEFDIVSRDAAKANYTYDSIPVDVVAQSELIINATPLGTYPNVEDAPSIPYAYVSPNHFLFDLVYNPPLTQFLAFGQQRGAKIMNGQKMLISQAEAAWMIWNR